MDYIISDLRSHFSYAYMTSSGYIAICIMVVFFLIVGVLLPGRKTADKICIAILFLYMFGVYSLTVLMRDSRYLDRSVVVVPFRWFTMWKETGKVTMAWLALENFIMLIIPGASLGYLFRRFGFIRRILSATLLMAFFSMTIEYTQFVLNIGVCELDDIICNTAGALVGAFLSLLVRDR